MRKLGKKVHEMVETVEAYCSCTNGCNVGSCSCSCTCVPSSTFTVTDWTSMSNSLTSKYNEQAKNYVTYQVIN
jgi:putative bacteriocin precursor